MRFHVVFEVLWNSCKKENVGFLKGMLSKFLYKPLFSFWLYIKL